MVSLLQIEKSQSIALNSQANNDSKKHEKNEDAVDSQNNNDKDYKSADPSLIDTSLHTQNKSSSVSSPSAHSTVSNGVQDGSIHLGNSCERLTLTKDDIDRSDITSTDDYKKMLESFMASREKLSEDSTQEIVRKAAKAVKSLKDTEFDIRFNPDVYSPTVRHANESSDELKNQRQLVKDAAEFLLAVQIPNFVSQYFQVFLLLIHSLPRLLFPS